MFEIDDEFLAKVGYDTSTLTDGEKTQYKAEMTDEMDARLTRRFLSELTGHQIEEFEDIQGNIDRARRWLDEFHSDYRERDDYRQLLAIDDSEDETIFFYASALWLRDAIPMYGEVIQEELDTYLSSLQKRYRLSLDTLDD